MNDIIEIIIFIVIAVAGFTLIYKLMPFRTWKNKKPKFTLFPKYIVGINKPIEEIESALIKNKFEKAGERKYTRGRIYGDFSAKEIKLSVCIDDKKKQIRLSASFFGVLFDNGDIWQVGADIANG